MLLSFKENVFFRGFCIKVKPFVHCNLNLITSECGFFMDTKSFCLS